MVKCPKGTPAQVKANIFNLTKSDTYDIDSLYPYDEKENFETSEVSDGLELDSNKADKRCRTTPKSELVNCFVSFIMDILIESWKGKLCYKPKLGAKESEISVYEEFGESDLYPCEYPSVLSTTVDYIKDLYKKRSKTLSKDNINVKSKTKSNSPSVESDELEPNAGENFDQVDVPEPWKSADEEVHLVFTNGVWYKGRVSRRLMEGEGVYFWEDGTTYSGDFIDGCPLGKGCINFPSLSVYEGDVYKGFRHGDGMYCMYDAPIMYTGQWWLGKKHGEGLIVYDEPLRGQNFYRGQWQDGEKEGFGYRQYPSGARYVGFWSNGKRHGSGVMIWSNNDVYSGHWKEGLMHGYGEYTWNGSVNKTLSYPATNTYRGLWCEGKRHGEGTFETINDGIIHTVWKDNIKEGPGYVVCANANVVIADLLFQNDKQAAFTGDEDLLRLRSRGASKNIMTFDEGHHKMISVPIHSSISSINLSRHVRRLLIKINDLYAENLLSNMPLMTTVKQSEQNAATLNEASRNKISNDNNDEEDVSQFIECSVEEEKNLRNAIILNIPKLKICYNYYATLACENTPPKKCVLLRLFFWQMLIDCNIPNSNLSLVDIDELLVEGSNILIENVHNPFERIRFAEFIHIIIIISWRLYGQYVYMYRPLVYDERLANFLEVYENSQSKHVLRAAFIYFIENDIFRSFEKISNEAVSVEAKFAETDLAPLEAMYMIYCEMGEPHSARDFLFIMYSQRYRIVQPGISRYFEKLPMYKLSGKNVFAVGGGLSYLPDLRPFNVSEIPNLEPVDPEPNLSIYNELTVKNIIQCLTRVCPAVLCDGLIVNMDYRITFLEFYKTIIACTELVLKLRAMKEIKQNILEEQRKKFEEQDKKSNGQEKMQENSVVPGKRSRQIIDGNKKGKH